MKFGNLRQVAKEVVLFSLGNCLDAQQWLEEYLTGQLHHHAESGMCTFLRFFKSLANCSSLEVSS